MEEFNDFTPKEAIDYIVDYAVNNDVDDERLSDAIKRLQTFVLEVKNRNKMNIKKFWESREKLAIHCKTQEEAKTFCEQAHKLGKRWIVSKESYLAKHNWDYYKEETCYTNYGTYANCEHYKRKGTKILEFEDIIWD